MSKKICILAVVLCLCMWNTVYARPLGTEDCGMPGKGGSQLEVSWDYLKWKNDDREHIYLIKPTFGLTDMFSLSLEVPYLVHNPDAGSPEEGIGDINLVGKYLLITEGENHPAFAVKGIVKFDNGDYDNGLGSGDKDYTLVAVATKSFGNAAFHANFGYTRIGDNKDENLRDITLFGFAVDYTVTEPVHLLAEINGNRHPDRTETEDPRSALLGVTYKVSEKLTLDGAYRWGLSNSYPEWCTTVGATITF